MDTYFFILLIVAVLYLSLIQH